MATPVSKITGIGIGGSSSSGASGQIQSSDGAGGFVGSAAIRAEVVPGFIDATNPQLFIGTAGNGVMLFADGGLLYLINEIATEYASVVANRLIATSLIYFGQFTTGAAPTYVNGASYFDTTLNKLRIGGASAWETVTSV